MMKIATPKEMPILSKRKINTIVKTLSSKNTISIILYGSQLSGNLNKNSDLDLLFNCR